MMTLLALIISFAAGITVGLQIKQIADKLNASMQALQRVHRQKNSGVVRPSIMPTQQPDTPSRSAVVRPRVPKDEVTSETDAALASVRSRTANR